MPTQTGGESAKCLCLPTRGTGSQKLAKSCLRSLWMPLMYFLISVFPYKFLTSSKIKIVACYHALVILLYQAKI